MGKTIVTVLDTASHMGLKSKDLRELFIYLQETLEEQIQNEKLNLTDLVGCMRAFNKYQLQGLKFCL